MIFTLLTFLAALSVAGVAEWFSVVGIMSIYAGAPFHAGLIMGLVLGFAKLVTVSWLYRNWKEAGWKLRAPMAYFTVALMVATSIGVFGFLTKAHLEQGAATVDNSAKVERLDQQIAREKSTIADNEKVIAQLDTAINAYMGKDKTDKALSVRKAQAPQRKQLRDEIDTAQKKVDGFDEEKLKLTSEVRALQLEVGPIRYIAELFYGTDGNESAKVESAVKLFTLLIVSTLDPLAVILLIAANHTLLQLQNGKKDKVSAQPEIHDIHHNPAEISASNNQAQDEEDANIQSMAPPDYATESRILHNTAEALPQATVDAELQEQAFSKDGILNEEATPLEVAQEIQHNQTPSVDGKPAETESKTEKPLDDIDQVLEVARHAKVFEISGKDKLNEEDVTLVTSFLRPETGTTPIITTPPHSRISMGLSGHTSAGTAVEDTVPVQDKAPVLAGHDSTILREMLGQHFIPQKINEEEKQAKTKSKGSSNASDYTGSSASQTQGAIGLQGSITQEIQEVAEVGAGNVQEVHNETVGASPETARDKREFPVNRNKYPVSLSWLKEFKGN
jgi:hypothetical protein